MPISVATSPSLRGLGAPLRVIGRRRAGEIAIVLSDDAELRELNRRWRGIDRATDVLSFPYQAAPAIAGDLVISLDRVREQAKRYRVSRGRELARLVIHGALHLAGHDHHRAGERRLMRSRENRVLRLVRGEVVKLDEVFTREARSRGTGGAPRGYPVHERRAPPRRDLGRRLGCMGPQRRRDRARMNRVFTHAHEVRVPLSAPPEQELYVTRPHALAAGLDYEKTPGDARRPSLRPEQSTAPAPPRPIPWSAIERIEWRHGGTSTGILIGTLTGAAILASVIALTNQSGGDVGPNPAGVILGAVAGGALAGVIASGVAAKTEVIYRGP